MRVSSRFNARGSSDLNRNAEVDNCDNEEGNKNVDGVDLNM